MSRAGGQPIATAYAEVGFRDAGLDAGIGRLTAKLTAFAGAIPQLLGGAAVIGAFTYLTSQVMGVVNSLDELRDRANETRTPIEQLSRLEFAGKLSGIEDVTGMLRFLQKNLAEAADGNKELSATFARLGVDASTFVSSGRPAIELMSDLVDRLTALPRASGIRDAMQIFGRSGGEVFKFESGAGLRDGMRAADAAGATVTQAQADAADAFNDELTKLTGTLQSLTRDAIMPMIPALTGLLDRLNRSRGSQAVQAGAMLAGNAIDGGNYGALARGIGNLAMFGAASALGDVKYAARDSAAAMTAFAEVIATGTEAAKVREAENAKPRGPIVTEITSPFVPPAESEADRRKLIRANRESAQYASDVANERLADALSALSDRRDQINEMARSTMPTMTSVGSFWATAQNAIATDYQREQLRVLQESAERLERLVDIASQQADIMNERLAGTPTLAP